MIFSSSILKSAENYRISGRKSDIIQRAKALPGLRSYDSMLIVEAILRGSELLKEPLRPKGNGHFRIFKKQRDTYLAICSGYKHEL